MPTFTWTRQTRTYDLDGDYVENSSETLSPPLFAYRTDSEFSVFTSNPVPQGEGVYLWRFERFPLDGSGSPLVSEPSTNEFRVTKYGQGSQVTRQVLDKRTNEGDWVEVYDQQVPSEAPEVDDLGITIYFILDPIFSTGSYRVDLRYFVDDVEQGTAVEAGTYDIRGLTVSTLKAECPTDPQEGEVLITADFYTEPAPGDSPLFPSGWLPTSGDIDWLLEITSTTGSLAPITSSSSILTSAPESDGRVASLSYLWDGKNSHGKFSREEAFLELQALCEAPGPGNTHSKYPGGANCFIRCARGENLVKRYYRMLSSGALAYLRVLYLSFDYCRPPQSMGYGWSSASSARVTEMTGGDLVFRSETGMVYRWTLSGTDYVPVHPDNYIEIEKDTGSTDARYVLSFKDHLVMRFHSSGRLTEEEDTNGNKVSYTNDGNGHLTEMSDDRGRTLYFTNRSDGQIESVRAMNPTTGRQVQFQYYGSSDPVSPDRLYRIIDPDGQTTEFEYDERGLLTKMTEIRSSVGDYVVEYAYTSDGRLYQETVNEELRYVYGYQSDYDEDEETSTHEMFVEAIDLTLPEEQQYPPLRSTLYRYDTNGSLIRIEEGFEEAQAS